MNINLTVLIPTYNPNILLLFEAFNSLNTQSYKGFKVLIVDESTSDLIYQVLDMVWNFDVEIIRPCEKLGLSRSLALGVNRCDTDFIARFDADDICMPDRFEVQMNYLFNHPNIDLVGSYVYKIDEKSVILGLRKYPISHTEICSSLHIFNPICHPAVMFRKSFFDNFGNYSEDFEIEDYELWLRSSSSGAKFHNIPLPLIKYRIQHVDGNSRPRHWNENLLLKLKYFDRKFFVISTAGIIVTTIATFFPHFIFKYVYTIFNKFR